MKGDFEEMDQLHDLSNREARKIIDSLKRGVTPIGYAKYLGAVGLDRYIKGQRECLEWVADGDTQLRIVTGQYGSGKTHFMDLTRDMALEMGFAVSFISAEDTPLYKIEEIYKKLAHKMYAPGLEKDRSELRGILDQWCERTREQVEAEMRQLSQIYSIESNYRSAIQYYVRHYGTEEAENAYKWLQGDKSKYDRSVRVFMDKSYAKYALDSLVRFLIHIRYKGLVVFIDELERIMNYNRSQRDNAYEIIKYLMIDNVDGIEGFAFIGSATPEMFRSDRGFEQHLALKRRLLTAFNDDGGPAIDYRGLRVDLERVPPTEDNYMEIARRVRAIHSKARRWNAEEVVDDNALRSIVRDATGYNVSPPSVVVTTTASILEKKQQNPEMTLNIADEVESSVKVIEERKQKPPVYQQSSATGSEEKTGSGAPRRSYQSYSE